MAYTLCFTTVRAYFRAVFNEFEIDLERVVAAALFATRRSTLLSPSTLCYLKESHWPASFTSGLDRTSCTANASTRYEESDVAEDEEGEEEEEDEEDEEDVEGAAEEDEKQEEGKPSRHYTLYSAMDSTNISFPSAS